MHSLLEWSAQHRWAAPGAERTATALREQGLPAGEQAGRTRPGAGSRLARLEPARGAGPGEHQPRASLRPHPREQPDPRHHRPARRTRRRLRAGRGLQDRPARGSRACAGSRALPGPARALRACGILPPGAPSRPPTSSSSARSRRSATPSSRSTSTPLANEIEGLLGRLGEGEFEVTHHPHKALCHDCPARERLCSHEIGAQMRDDPDPPIVPIPRSERPRPEPAEGAEAEGGAQPQTSLLD